MIQYAGKKVTITGTICKVFGDEFPTGAVLRGYEIDCSASKLIECEFWEKRRLQFRGYGPGAGLIIRGHVMKEQKQSNRIKLDYCRLVAEY